MNRLAAFLFAVSLALIAALPAKADDATVKLVGDRLKAGELNALHAELAAKLEQSPADDQVRFALGATEFLSAVEHLAQAMYRHGLQTSRELQREMPFFRFPVPPNPSPEPLTYETLRDIFKTAVNEFATADATLAAIKADDVKLMLPIGQIRLDLNGDGKADDQESLFAVFNATLGGGGIPAEASEQFTIAFDRADVAWLRGYTHLLRALIEFALAHDGKASFEVSFHMLFPRAGLPNEALTRQPPNAFDTFNAGQFADAIAFVHLMHWPVMEPERRVAALGHLESVVEMSRESWRFIQAETDDEAEWIPAPRQKNGAIPGATISQQTVDGWMLFLDEFGAILKGEKLVPHWRLEKGINLRRAMLDEKVFDPILWAQGSAALPYLEDGPMTDAQTWDTIMRMLEGNFLGYAIWFN